MRRPWTGWHGWQNGSAGETGPNPNRFDHDSERDRFEALTCGVAGPALPVRRWSAPLPDGLSPCPRGPPFSANRTVGLADTRRLGPRYEQPTQNCWRLDERRTNPSSRISPEIGRKPLSRNGRSAWRSSFRGRVGGRRNDDSQNRSDTQVAGLHSNFSPVNFKNAAWKSNSRVCTLAAVPARMTSASFC